MAERHASGLTTSHSLRERILPKTSKSSPMTRSSCLRNRPMLARFTSLLILLVPFPAWAQVAPGASGGGMSGGDDQMMVPAPASGEAYSKSTGLETRSNYFLAGIYVDSAYLSNL